MTMWDATRAELAQVLKEHGFQPLDDEHVLTCAIDAIRKLQATVERLEWETYASTWDDTSD